MEEISRHVETKDAEKYVGEEEKNRMEACRYLKWESLISHQRSEPPPTRPAIFPKCGSFHWRYDGDGGSECVESSDPTAEIEPTACRLGEDAADRCFPTPLGLPAYAVPELTSVNVYAHFTASKWC